MNPRGAFSNDFFETGIVDEYVFIGVDVYILFSDNDVNIIRIRNVDEDYMFSSLTEKRFTTLLDNYYY